ncbi:SHOCT domain-containing protein [Streptomyces sp. TRM S81-3]|uniref:SHOCT domain-containing protein n=1 Tax=Streptomyces griseicoloratus TaxID=2752516 RepID=A0A926L510_9ACTN|nr:SHOCT domain-containing protein [Streptomyces griseicoloratus]MBD0422717.1 SHOCT domain-containing protein [Streptomyces griseicoloratus]
MMFWYAHGMGGWAWFGMSVGMVLFWALIIAALVLVLRAVNQPHAHTHTPAAPTPQEILGERFARGEIDEEEYQRRLNTLRTGPPPKA